MPIGRLRWFALTLDDAMDLPSRPADSVGVAWPRWVTWPLRQFNDQRELRRLRRQFPYAWRRLINTPNGTRRETDAEYLARLRAIRAERAAARARR